MAIPKPKPDLPDVVWIEAVENRVCCHLACGIVGESIKYKLPHCDVPWNVCSECADELDNRLLDRAWGWMHVEKEGIGRLERRSAYYQKALPEATNSDEISGVAASRSTNNESGRAGSGE